MNRRVNYKTIEELKLLQVQYIVNSASDFFKGPKWCMRLYKNPGTSLRVSMGIQLSFRLHWWLRCLVDERCNKAGLSRGLGRWVPQHQWCGKVPGNFSRRFQAESEGSLGLLEHSLHPGRGERVLWLVEGTSSFWELSVSGFVGKGVAWILGKRSYWLLEFLPEGVESTWWLCYNRSQESGWRRGESLVGEVMRFCLSLYLDR